MIRDHIGILNLRTVREWYYVTICHVEKYTNYCSKLMLMFRTFDMLLWPVVIYGEFVGKSLSLYNCFSWTVNSSVQVSGDYKLHKCIYMYWFSSLFASCFHKNVYNSARGV